MAVNKFNGVAITAASKINGVTAAKINGQTISSGSGPTLVANEATGGTVNGVTSAAVNTVGANLIVVSISYYTELGADGDSITDSEGNTWTALTRRGTPSVSLYGQRFFYCYNPTTSAAHTFTYSDTDSYPVIAVAAFSGIAASPFDQQNGSQDSGNWTTVQPGSITPSQANTIAVVALTHNTASVTISINDSYTKIEDIARSSGNHVASALAYKVLTDTTSQNPTWTASGTCDNSAVAIANFKY